MDYTAASTNFASNFVVNLPTKKKKNLSSFTHPYIIPSLQVLQASKYDFNFFFLKKLWKSMGSSVVVVVFLIYFLSEYTIMIYDVFE